ncbi:MAG TPA: bifunctional pyr operon transcriptional regulator/uracil phosphoribosyltransferase PyrR [Firmicutes bacterium]|nr:bifunctional pyr operon transcriptional regulator/uracil phosphoribosyltransferase PyrR [Bacillota bacterium]
MQILNADEMRRAVTRLAMQAVETQKGTDFVLIGIRTRGVILARRMQKEIARLEGTEIPLGILDISLYRDDLLDGCDAVFKGSEVDFDIEGKNVVLCDDVIYTGRTVRAALAALSSMGRAKTVRLFTLIDRGHRELPFRADGVGKNVPTARSERIVVHFVETDGADSVDLYK